MSTNVNYFKIGSFVICSIIILILGVIALSSGALDHDVVMFETYIDESVQGLSAGSPVMQRGVQIGRVEKITFVSREYDMPHGSEDYLQYNKYVLVIMSIDRANYQDLSDEEIESVVRRSVLEGLRLKLAYQGITGLAYVDADYVDTKRFPPVKIKWKPKRLYMPSAPSTLVSFTQAIDTVFQRLDHIDFEKISKQFEETLALINKTISDAEISDAREQLMSLISELRATNGYILKLMEGSATDPSAPSIPDTIAQFSSALKRLDQLIASQQSQLDEIMANLVHITQNMRELTEQLRKQPSQILFSSPPPRSEVVK